MQSWKTMRIAAAYSPSIIPFAFYLFFRPRSFSPARSMASWAPVNPLTATAAELQAGLTTGKYNSSQLVDLYLEQIARHNDYLRAVIETAPVAVLYRQASQLDEERASGKTRGPLHGIPILLKVSLS
jgi:amidase